MNVAGAWHDARRRVRVIAREVRHSPLVGRARAAEARRAGLEAVYRETNRLLQRLGAEYWLVQGTLLGHHREGRLLDGDRDVDFGAHEKEFARIWQARTTLPAGFRMYDTSRRHHGPKLYVVHRAWEADIYFYRDDGVRLQSYVDSDDGGDRKPFARELVYPLRPATFLGEPTRVPHDPEAYLIHVYGYIGRGAIKDRATGYWHPKTS